MRPYYADEFVTLYQGDCLEIICTWTDADVLVTDPPYGRDWQSGAGLKNANNKGRGSKRHQGIANDSSPAARDEALAAWGVKPGMVFGDLLIAPPPNAVQCLIYAKAADAGIRGARAGFRRDAEAIYLTGSWPCAVGGRTSVVRSRSWVAGPTSPAFRYGHPHAKPVDLIEELLTACPPGVIADPFAGSGSILVAARNAGRKAIGIEIEEQYCDLIVRRLSQGVLPITDVSDMG